MINRFWSSLMIWACLSLAARACPIPVYQYALEHWSADPYEIEVRHGAPLDEVQRAALETLQRAERGDGTPANLRVRVRREEDAALPARLTARYPEVARIREPFWTGALSPAEVALLLDSPLRRRLGEAQVRRTSAVWILLESGDRRADREVEALLRRELERLEKTIEVPSSAEWGGEDIQIDDHVNFQIFRLRRDDPEERVLVRMLLHTEPDLAEGFADQPIVFPVYGRGLVLYALVGRGINAWTIEEAARFLTGPCSCQIKAANPGTDLLMQVDWDGRIRPMTPAAVSATVGTGAFLQRLKEAAEEKNEE